MLAFEDRIKPCQIGNEHYALERNQMIDDFRNCPEEDLHRYFKSRPAVCALGDYRRAHLAATVEKLCLERNIPAPTWVSLAPYTLKTPVYPPTLAKYDFMRKYIDEHIDPIFAKHGILLDEEGLRRA